MPVGAGAQGEGQIPVGILFLIERGSKPQRMKCRLKPRISAAPRSEQPKKTKALAAKNKKGSHTTMNTNTFLQSTNAVNPVTGDSLRYAVGWAIAACAIGMNCSAIAAESVSFTRITEGAIATDLQQSMAVAWGDYDGDGDLDVYFTSTGATLGALYRNASGGKFERVTGSPIATDLHYGFGCAWADFDNDGDLDIFRSNWIHESSRLYLNRGTNFSATTYLGDQRSTGVIWGDYDNDGHLDLYLPSGGIAWGSTRRVGMLFRNDGRGRLTRMLAASVGPIVSQLASGISGVWSDFNDDGLPDLFVANYGEPNSLFLNSPDHRFVRVTESPLVQEAGAHTSVALGDYDNDGDMDLFIAEGSSKPNSLFRNEGGGKFRKITEGSVVTDLAQSLGAAWADYDNDGWIDLFVANGENLEENNFLYRNNGDGTFRRVLEGGPANDGGYSFGCAWGDYDNDGFLDLIVANGAMHAVGQQEPNQPEANFLYRNNGNANRWLRIRCVGTTSNRSGLGARVRVRATIGGKTFWQMREVNSGNGFCGNAIDAHFGLGDAETVDTLRVEWPSGTVQELRGIAAGQLLTLTEPPRLKAVGAGKLQLPPGWKGQEFRIESSSDLEKWVPFQTVASSGSTDVIALADQDAPSAAHRYYRASNRPLPSDWRTAASIDAGGHNDVNTPALEGCPIESPDGHALFFASNRAGGQGGIDIWMARRDGPNEPWRNPVNLPPPVNSASDDFCPTPLPGNELFFVSRRPGGCAENSADIYHTRLDLVTGWQEPSHLGCAVNSAGDELSPAYATAGGGRLYFSSNRDGAHKIVASPRQPDGSFGAPTEITELNAPGFNTFRPNVSEDGLEMVFDSDRPGGLGGLDVWAATRTSVMDPWRAPVNLGPKVNSALAESRASLSRDGKRLIFGSTRPGGQGSSDLYLSTR